MPNLKDILTGIRAKHGNKSQVAKKLGISSQLLGQYEKGTRNPKKDFYDKWKEVFEQDIEAMMKEANVSHETKKPTSDSKPAIKEKAPDPEEYRLLKKSLNSINDTNAYLLARVRELEERLRGGSNVVGN